MTHNDSSILLASQTAAALCVGTKLDLSRFVRDHVGIAVALSDKQKRRRKGANVWQCKSPAFVEQCQQLGESHEKS
jgi:hypothetical protein